jgi:VanZ family protein
MRVQLIRRLDPWLPPVLLMAAIFALSAQPTLDSGLGLADQIGRKLVHFAEYALLSFLCWRALRTRMDRRRAAIAAFLVAAAYAATDEYHQTFIEGRHGSVMDWLFDSAGAAAAAIRLGALRGARKVRA